MDLRIDVFPPPHTCSKPQCKTWGTRDLSGRWRQIAEEGLGRSTGLSLGKDCVDHDVSVKLGGLVDGDRLLNNGMSAEKHQQTSEKFA